jgi:hypothetical protein
MSFEEDSGAAGDQSCPPFDGDGARAPVDDEEEAAPEKAAGLFDEDEDAEGD